MSSDNNNNNNVKSEEPQTTENITPQVVPTEDPTNTSNNNNNNNSNNNNNNNNNQPEKEKEKQKKSKKEQKSSSDPQEEEEKEKKPNAKELRKQERLAKEIADRKAKDAKALLFSTIFGNSQLINSNTHNSRNYIDLSLLSDDYIGKIILLRARVHTSRKTGKRAFVVFRSNGESIQGVISVGDDISNNLNNNLNNNNLNNNENNNNNNNEELDLSTAPKEMVDYISSVSLESIVDAQVRVIKTNTPVKSTTKQNLELNIIKFHVVSTALGLPFQLEDAARRIDSNKSNNNNDSNNGGVIINFDTRLTTRWLDMRTPASNSLFKLQSKIGQYFREFMTSNDFFEIHSPKIISAASEGGANVFKLDYFGKSAFLAQSPQLYKQMAIQGDLPRVYEIGPVFRAENSNTHRHLTEFIGLDCEMIINEHYYEILDVAEGLFYYIFNQVEKLCGNELNLVREQHPFEPLVFQMDVDRVKDLGVEIIDDNNNNLNNNNLNNNNNNKDPYNGKIKNLHLRMLRIPFKDCISLLNTKLPKENQLQQTDDINTTNEKLLGQIIKTRYGVDFFISDRFPSALRPFYTMICPDDNNYSNSFDMFIRGEEISSGAQRIHNVDILIKRAKDLGVDINSINDYINSFRLGAWPHGGFGIGLERVVMLYLGLGNIRYVSMFPRDPQRAWPHGGFGIGLERVVMLYLGLGNIRYVSMFPRDPQRITP